jgi:uncharacterized protein YecE (DUF72 family)
LPLLDRIRIGISGWNYPGWRGKFYPKNLPHRRELSYAAGVFRTIEINGTFYSLKRPENFAQWFADTPDDFVFSVKGSRYLTHMLRLRNGAKPLANFFASGLLRLGLKLGPVLWQLPASFSFDPKRLEAFFKLLPRDTEAAAALARRHDKRVSGRTWLKADAIRGIRHCIEIRHKSFLVPEFIDLLRKHDVALVCADTVEWPRLVDVTSNFVYCRLHGSEELYASGYNDAALRLWATRIAEWARGEESPDGDRVAPPVRAKRAARDVFVYFDNDAKIRAPFDAQGLLSRVKSRISSGPP